MRLNLDQFEAEMDAQRACECTLPLNLADLATIVMVAQATLRRDDAPESVKREMAYLAMRLDALCAHRWGHQTNSLIHAGWQF